MAQHGSDHGPKRWLLLAAACLQNSTTTGLLFGYAALEPALQSLKSSGDDDVDVAQVFTFAMTVNMLSPLVLAGPILDSFGPRLCSCVCTGLVGAGFFLFGISPWLSARPLSWLLPAFLLIGAGGPGCQCCLFHTANLFQARGFALNMITASIGVSFVVFELLVALSKWCCIPLPQMFLLYSAIPWLHTAISAATMADVPFESSERPASPPVTPSPSPPTNEVVYAANLAAFGDTMALADVTAQRASEVPIPQRHHVRILSLGAARPMVFVRSKKQSRQVRTLTGEPLLPDREGSTSPGSVRQRFPALHRPKQEEENVDLMGASLGTQLQSRAFFELALFFGTSSLFFNLFCGNMQDLAKATLAVADPRLTGTQLAAASAANVSVYLSLSPLMGVLNPILGHVIDNFGFQPMLLLALLSPAAQALALSQGEFFLGTLFFSVFQASMFSYMYSYLAFEFGFEYYGLLAGFIQSVGSVMTLVLQPQLRQVAATYGWVNVQRIQMASFGLLGLVILGMRAFGALLARRRRCRLPRTPGGTVVPKDLSPPGRSFSTGDVHAAVEDKTCRRRSELFPHADDILLVDGGDSRFSHAAYQIESCGGKGQREAALSLSPERSSKSASLAGSPAGGCSPLASPKRKDRCSNEEQKVAEFQDMTLPARVRLASTK